MIRRVALLFAIMGLGQVFTIFGLKYLASTGQWSGVAKIGEIETVIQALIYVIGFGIQTDAIRTIAYTEDWKSRLDDFQVARLTLSLILLPLIAISFVDWTYGAIIVAPALALSCDYALYARGLPIPAALVALLRAVVPLGTAIAMTQLGMGWAPEAYLAASVLIFIVTNWMISYRLQVPAWWKPAFHSLRLFLRSLPIGLVNLCQFFLGLGIIFVARFLVATEELAIAYIALKFYMIFKGSIRVIQQGFINKMKISEVCFRVDQISALIGLMIFTSALIYPQAFIGLFFGAGLEESRLLFLLLGASALVYGLFGSLFTKALLENRELEVLRIALMAVAVSILILLLQPLSLQGSEQVMVGVLAGEITIVFGVVWRLMPLGETMNRVGFLIKCSPAMLIPVAVHYIFQESVITYAAAVLIMGGSLLVLNYRQLVKGTAEIMQP